MKINTHWSEPKTNIFSALWCLKSALASGENARLIKMKNEDCQYPIKLKNVNENFRSYEFSNGTLQTRQDILDDTNKTEFEKQLTLNYKTCYGTKKAAEHYYLTGKLSNDNFQGVGYSHLVHVKDIIKFFKSHPDKNKQESAIDMQIQYFEPEGHNISIFYDNYRFAHGSPWIVKQFKRKLWVVELLDDKPAKIPAIIKILNWISYPLKFIPKRDILKMDEYTNYTFSVGSVVNGYSIEIQIPKKFSFK